MKKILSLIISIPALYAALLLLFSCKTAEKKTAYNLIDRQPEYIEQLGKEGFRIIDSNFVFFEIGENYIIRLISCLQANQWSKVILDSADITDGLYDDNLLFFEKNEKEQLLIWKQEGEYWPYLQLYLFADNHLNFIGDLSVGIDCKGCDSMNIPDEIIEVIDIKEGLAVLFSDNVVYRGSNFNKVPYHSVNIPTDNLMLLYDGSKTTINIK